MGDGELILSEKYLRVTFRFKKKIARTVIRRVLTDQPETEWVRIDLTKLLHIQGYTRKRWEIWWKASRKQSLRNV